MTRALKPMLPLIHGADDMRDVVGALKHGEPSREDALVTLIQRARLGGYRAGAADMDHLRASPHCECERCQRADAAR